MKHRNIGLALLLVAALGSQTMLGLTAREITVNRDAIKALLNTPISANQADNEANANKLRLHRDTLKKAKKLTNEAEINNKINDFRYGKTRAELYQESLDIQETSAAGVSACSADLQVCQKDLTLHKTYRKEDEEEIQAGRKEIARLRQELDQTEGQLKQALADLTAGKGASAATLQKAQDALKVSSEELRACQDSIREKDTTLKEQRAELAKVKAELTKKTEESQKNYQYWQETDGKAEAAQKELEAAKKKIVAQQAEINEAKAAATAAEVNLQKCNQSLTNTREKRDEALTRVKELEEASVQAAY